MFTQASANILANYIIHGSTSSYNGTTYLALSTTDPSSSVTEPTESSGYKRIGLADAFGGSASVSATLVSDTTNGNYYQIANTSEINFPHAQTTINGITHWAIYSASSGASTTTLLAYGAFASSIDLAVNDVFTIEAGKLVITFK